VAKAQSEKLGRRSGRVFYGWWIVAISLIVDALKHGTFNRGFTIYFLPIQEQLGISRAALSLAETLGRLVGGIQGPVGGYLTDRFGPRAMTVAGGVISGLGFILLAFTHSYLYFMLVFVGLLSVGFRAGYNNATMPAVNEWFQRKKSLAMSLASIGSGLGGVAITPLIALLVFGFGWRTAALASGVAIVAVVVPLAFLVRRSPESMGLLPDGDTVPPASVTRGAGQRGGRVAVPGAAGLTEVVPLTRRSNPEVEFTAREAMRTRSYWLFVVAVGLRNTVHSGVSFHLVPLLVWAGTSQPKAALLVALLSFGTLVSNPIVGWMGDSWSKQRLSAVAMVTGILAMLMLLITGGQLWQLAILVLLLAFAESANPLAWAIVGDFFGRRSYATLRGWQHLPDQLMSMSTPVWMGLIYDRTESYFWAVVPLAAMYGLSAAFYWMLPRPRPPERLAG
jgi:MFS family permease